MKAAKDEDGEIQQARVICGFTHEGKRFEPDDIFEGPASDVWQWERTGNVDAHRDAIAHAKSLPRKESKKNAPRIFE